MTSLWLFLQGGDDAWNAAYKQSMHTYFKKEHKKLVRDRKPMVSLERLPSPQDLRRDHPELFNAAYRNSLPVNAPVEVEQGVIAFDNSASNLAKISKYAYIHCALLAAQEFSIVSKSESSYTRRC